MATTLKARSGSSMIHVFRYTNSAGEVVDTTGSTARFQLRDVKSFERVILNTVESATAGALLFSDTPGEWELNLPPELTATLSHTVRWELELANPNGSVVTIEVGVIKVEPESVSME